VIEEFIISIFFEDLRYISPALFQPTPKIFAISCSAF